MPTMIREDAWPRIRALAAKMGWDVRTAIGCVVSLWDDSQKVGVHTATAQEIAFWCQEHDHGKHQMLIEALADNAVRFVTRVNETHFKIRGNEEEISRIRAAQKNGRRNAKSRWNKEKGDAGRIASGTASRIPSGMQSGMPELNQAEPSQAKPSQAKPKLVAEGTSAPSTTTPGSRVWEAYREAYETAYRQTPIRNSKANSLCKQLVERLGEEGATLVVRFYLTHRNAWYVQRCHPLDAAVKDAEGLLVQAKANYRVSSSEAKAQDQSQGNEEVFARVAAKMEARRLAREAGNAGE